MTIASLADFESLLNDLPRPDSGAEALWAAREPQLTKPAGSLGRLEEISRHLSVWQGRHPPRLDRVRARVFAGNHGVAARGVSAFPAEVTAQMVLNFEHGGAAINQLCRAFDIELAVAALALDRPTADFAEGPAMTEGECVEALSIGMDSVPDATDLLIVGEMGIANTSSASAIALALFGGSGVAWVGRGTGINDAAISNKIKVVEAAVARNGGGGALETLRRLGGRELAAMAGAILAARLRRIPVILDGFVCTAAAAVLHAARPGALDHCLAGHASAEAAHRRLLERLGLRPLLDLDMRLGEASGAALAVALARGALACHTGMATFGEAGVSDKEE